jgi:hypothetical protein
MVVLIILFILIVLILLAPSNAIYGGARELARRPRATESSAYVTYIMRGDRYVPGVVAWANSIRATGTTKDIVCLGTKDVSPAGVAKIAKACKFVEVPYIQHARYPLRGSKQEAQYSSWQDVSFTKFNMVDPKYCPYDKVLFLDADTIVMKNIDHLFELETPSGTFTNAWEAKAFKEKKGMIVNPYRRPDGSQPPHGSLITRKQIIEGLTAKEGSFVAFGTPLLLKPSTEAAIRIHTLLTEKEIWGYPGCISGTDEQFAVELFPEDWHNISQAYNFIAGKPEFLEGQEPYVIHYFNEKPWEIPKDKYPDLKIWWSSFFLAGGGAPRKKEARQER